MIRALHVDPSSEWRGGQAQIVALASHLPGLGVATPQGSPLSVALAGRGVPVFDLPTGGGTPTMLALRRWVLSLRPELLAAHSSHAHQVAWLAGGGTPLIVHRRVDFAPGGSWLSRRKYAAPVGYVAVSCGVRDVLVRAGVDARRICVVHDALTRVWAPVDRADARARWQIPDGARWIAAIGALVPHKGHRVLIDAMATPALADARCVIAGDGPLRGALARQIAERGVGDRVRLLGFRDDLADWVPAIDVLAHPSVEEGFGQVVLEARAAGVPVVASGVGGLPEAVGEGGALVPVGDVAAWSDALSGALPDARAADARACGAPGRVALETEAAWARLMG